MRAFVISPLYCPVYSAHLNYSMKKQKVPELHCARITGTGTCLTNNLLYEELNNYTLISQGIVYGQYFFLPYSQIPLGN